MKNILYKYTKESFRTIFLFWQVISFYILRRFRYCFLVYFDYLIKCWSNIIESCPLFFFSVPPFNTYWSTDIFAPFIFKFGGFSQSAPYIMVEGGRGGSLFQFSDWPEVMKQIINSFDQPPILPLSHSS